MDYRTDYCEKLNISLPNNWDIHHIDSDRDNNDLKNLIALPNWLHHSFHFYMNYYPRSIFFKYVIDDRLNTDSLRKMVDILELVQECVVLKINIQMGRFDDHLNEDFFKKFEHELSKKRP